MSTFQNVLAIITDWSGVVSYDQKAVHAANCLMMQEYGLRTLPFEEWLACATASPREFFLNRGVDRTAEEIYADYRRVFPKVCANGNRPTIYAGAAEFLSKAGKNRTLGVISSHPQESLEIEAEEYGVRDHIHFLEGSSPNKANSILRRIEVNGFTPEQVVYIGDMISDIHAAHRAGVRIIAVTTGYHSREILAREKPWILAESLADLQHEL